MLNNLDSKNNRFMFKFFILLGFAAVCIKANNSKTSTDKKLLDLVKTLQQAANQIQKQNNGAKGPVQNLANHLSKLTTYKPKDLANSNQKNGKKNDQPQIDAKTLLAVLHQLQNAQTSAKKIVQPFAEALQKKKNPEEKAKEAANHFLHPESQQEEFYKHFAEYLMKSKWIDNFKRLKVERPRKKQRSRRLMTLGKKLNLLILKFQSLITTTS